MASVGSRVRILLGETASDWIIFLNHEDTTRWWQTQHRSVKNTLPTGLVETFHECARDGYKIEQIEWTVPTNAVNSREGEPYFFVIATKGSEGRAHWECAPEFRDDIHGTAIQNQDIETRFRASFGYDQDNLPTYVGLIGNNGYSTSANVPEELKNRLQQINGGKKSVHFVRLFQNNGFFIADDEGYLWGGIDCVEDLTKICQDTVNEGGRIYDVAIAKNGSWIVVTSNEIYGSDEAARAPDPDLVDVLLNFYAEQGQRNQNLTTAAEQMRELSKINFAINYNWNRHYGVNK